MIARINGRTTFRQISSIYHNGNLITDQSEILEVLADYFCEISSDSNLPPAFLSHKLKVESSPLIIPDQPWATDF